MAIDGIILRILQRNIIRRSLIKTSMFLKSPKSSSNQSHCKSSFTCKPGQCHACKANLFGNGNQSFHI